MRKSAVTWNFFYKLVLVTTSDPYIVIEAYVKQTFQQILRLIKRICTSTKKVHRREGITYIPLKLYG